MNRTVLVRTVLCAAALTAGGCASAAVSGEAVILPEFRSLQIHASFGPNGPGGTASAGVRSTYSVTGRVTCVAVAGRRATIGIKVDPNSSFGGRVGHMFFVEDNGSPGDGVDLANDERVDSVPRVCSPPTDEQLVPFPFLAIRPQPIASGDIVVRGSTIAGGVTRGD